MCQIWIVECELEVLIRQKPLGRSFKDAETLNTKLDAGCEHAADLQGAKPGSQVSFWSWAFRGVVNMRTSRPLAIRL